RAVWRIVHSINVAEGARSSCQPNYLLHTVDRSYGIRGVADRNEFCVAVDLAREVRHVERAVGFVDFNNADCDATLFKSAPWRKIRIVIKIGQHDFVARSE